MTMLQMSLAPIEGRHLLALVDEYIALLDGPRDAQDSALDRLAPDAYPDDAAAAAEFRLGTREDAFDQRVADALEVRTSLDHFEEDAGQAPRATAVSRGVEIDTDVLDAWLRTLSGMRLVLATRLGIDTSDAHDPDDPSFMTYDWLGYRLEVLIQLADRNDAR